MLYQDDLPVGVYETLANSRYLPIDTETLGLKPHRDRLCLVQMCNEDGVVAMVQVRGRPAPYLTQLLAAEKPLKIFHFARFDLGILLKTYGVRIPALYCTKVASKIARTSTDKHGLKDLVQDFLGVTLDKAKQTSDWGAPELSQEQLAYARHDVVHLVALKDKLDALLEREGRKDLAFRAMQCLPAIAELDLMGWEGLFEH